MSKCGQLALQFATLAVGLVGVPIISGGTPFVARAVQAFEYTGQPPLDLPTAVAVAPDGRVFVVDGVNDRLLAFRPDGTFAAEIRALGDQRLSRPLSAHCDPDGRLWIADTGHSRVLIGRPDGPAVETLDLEPPERGGPDLTDVVPAPDGSHAWLVDNDHGRLLHIDRATRAVTSIGRPGEALGQFQYPFMLARSRDGYLYVTDVLNARVQVLTPLGVPAGTIGAYGADLGQLYRPTGVACDADGNVWVADDVLDVVQVFTRRGELRDVLRDADGRPFKLAGPMGLTFDVDGNLYVAELRANRARKFAIAADPQAPPAPRATPAQTLASGNQAPACTVCHFEWLPPFHEGRGTALLDPPPTTAEQPVVSRGETCLSCHNGAVVDSRRRVWREHGHATGVLPPVEMTVPADLPLVDGRVACRTCHSAHAGTPAADDLRTAVFVRLPQTGGELCVGCHADKTRGPQVGTHPTGEMPWPVPPEIIAAGGHVGANPSELTCEVCHTPHGAAHEHLLVMGTESNELCLTCHDRIRPGMFRETGGEHPVSPLVSTEQAEAVRELGTRVSADGRLICLSCHRLHHGKGERFMLADELTDGQFCLRCHAERRALLGTAHDLRASHADEQNRLGLTAQTGGPCSSCHLFHNYARPAEASDVDRGGGKCITCHQAGRVAGDKPIPAQNHPPIGCTICHDPHREGVGQFLPAPPAEICARCHPKNAAVANGPHDVRTSKAAWPTASRAAQDACLGCHRPHGDPETGLFRAGSAADVPGPDGTCVVCHSAARSDSNQPLALQHPSDTPRLKIRSGLPLGRYHDGAPQVACRTCHDPHAGSGFGSHLLRIPLGRPPEEICVTCHTETTHMNATGHSDEALHAAGFQPGVCTPCHVVHACSDDIAPRYLWPKNLDAAAQVAALDPAPTTTAVGADPGHLIAAERCNACHRLGGRAPPPAVATHPPVEMSNPAAPPEYGYLPLFNADGEVDPRGRISCRTCHLPHGRLLPAPVPAGRAALSSRELRARSWHLRSFGEGNVCATCHGFDALRRFMYFHDPARRGGPLTTVTVTGR